MSNNPLHDIPADDRVSIRAVVTRDGEDPAHALAAAGIDDPVSIPIMFGEDPPDMTFGDIFTPNLTGVLETEMSDEEPGHMHGTPAKQSEEPADPPPLSRPTTTTLPPAFGMRPLAPVRRTVRDK